MIHAYEIKSSKKIFGIPASSFIIGNVLNTNIKNAFKKFQNYYFSFSNLGLDKNPLWWSCAILNRIFALWNDRLTTSIHNNKCHSSQQRYYRYDMQTLVFEQICVKIRFSHSIGIFHIVFPISVYSLQPSKIKLGLAFIIK